MFGLEFVGQAKQYLELFAYIQALDTNKDGVPDLPQELLLKLAKLKDQMGAVHTTCIELGDLVGDDIEAIKTKLGI
jgi:hypothetical protein